MSNKNTIEIGDRVEDRINKLTGIVVGIWDNVSHIEYSVCSEKLKDGAPAFSTQWIEGYKLKIVKKKVIDLRWGK